MVWLEAAGEGGVGAGYTGVMSTLTSASVAALSLEVSTPLTLCTFDLRLEAAISFILCFFSSA